MRIPCDMDQTKSLSRKTGKASAYDSQFLLLY